MSLMTTKQVVIDRSLLAEKPSKLHFLDAWKQTNKMKIPLQSLNITVCDILTVYSYILEYSSPREASGELDFSLH